MKNRIEIEGVTFTAQDTKGACGGCAFLGRPQCQDAIAQQVCMDDEINVIWVRADEPTADEAGCAPKLTSSQEECRSSYCECPEGQCSSGRVDKRADQAEQNTKPTNPKDAIGIRKAPLSCVPMNVVAEIGTGMLEGAAKYGRHNYRAIGVRASVYFDATMRHLISWWEGEDIDPDSGMNHIAKALTSLTVLRDAQLQGKCEDDRPPKSQPFYPQLNDQAAAILDRHADKNPHHYTQKDLQ